MHKLIPRVALVISVFFVGLVSLHSEERDQARFDRGDQLRERGLRETLDGRPRPSFSKAEEEDVAYYSKWRSKEIVEMQQREKAEKLAKERAERPSLGVGMSNIARCVSSVIFPRGRSRRGADVSRRTEPLNDSALTVYTELIRVSCEFSSAGFGRPDSFPSGHRTIRRIRDGLWLSADNADNTRGV